MNDMLFNIYNMIVRSIVSAISCCGFWFNTPCFFGQRYWMLHSVELGQIFKVAFWFDSGGSKALLLRLTKMAPWLRIKQNTSFLCLLPALKTAREQAKPLPLFLSQILEAKDETAVYQSFPITGRSHEVMQTPKALWDDRKSWLSTTKDKSGNSDYRTVYQFRCRPFNVQSSVNFITFLPHSGD